MFRARAMTVTLTPTLLDDDMGSGCPVCCARPGAPSFREEVILLAFPLASRPSAVIQAFRMCCAGCNDEPGAWE